MKKPSGSSRMISCFARLEHHEENEIRHSLDGRTGDMRKYVITIGVRHLCMRARRLA